jgi:hypothetical protein
MPRLSEAACNRPRWRDGACCGQDIGRATATQANLYIGRARRVMARRLPAPWRVEEIAGGYVVKDANGQSLAYVYGAEAQADADIAKTLTREEAARNIAKLPVLLRKPS